MHRQYSTVTPFRLDENNVSLNCSANSTDSNINICVDDEFVVSNHPKPTRPRMVFDNYVGKPKLNRYFQYRVIMEADENLACGGTPCLPDLISIDLGSEGVSRYYGEPQVVESQSPIAYRDIQSISIDADTCVGFQLSPDRKNYYFWNGKSWSSTDSKNEHNTASEVESYIVQFSNQFENGNLHFKAILTSDTITPCEIGKINLDYRIPL